jgi:RimJ/RimL family protein N-acetyltransferase
MIPPMMTLAAAPLGGRFVRLEPVTPAVREALQAALEVDPDNWNIQYVNGRGEGFAAYWEALTGQVERRERIAFAVRRLEDDRVVGTSSFHHISAANRTVEIGSTFFHPDARGTAVNPETKLLMLGHAFEAGALRVQLSVDSRNQHSQAACAKLGPVPEGVLRRHLVTWTGHRRDTVVFSVIETEWPAVRDGLVERLQRFG